MTLSDVKGYAISAALASSILFGYGYHPTIDAIIVTIIWIWLGFCIIAMAGLSVATVVIRKHDNSNDKDLGAFYKALSAMHTSIVKRLIGLGFVGYWLYALVVQEWTVTAVFYVILTVYVQAFTFLTKDIAKEFFVNQLKGEGLE